MKITSKRLLGALVAFGVIGASINAYAATSKSGNSMSTPRVFSAFHHRPGGPGGSDGPGRHGGSDWPGGIVGSNGQGGTGAAS